MSVSNFFDLRGPQLSTAQGAISSLRAVAQPANADRAPQPPLFRPLGSIALSTAAA